MALIENSKLYSGKDLENIFFRPLVSGPTAEQLGIRVLYNMPQTSLIHMWSPSGTVLKPFKAGWQGSSATPYEQKEVRLCRVKAENSFDAQDYYSLVLQNLVSREDINLQDLSGSDLEAAETEIFKKSIAEGLRITMWIGNDSLSGGYNTFNGIFTQVTTAYESEGRSYLPAPVEGLSTSNITTYLDEMWAEASEELKSLKKEGELAFFVSSDVYNVFEDYVYDNSEMACINNVDAHPTLSYRGIPLVDIGITPEMLSANDMFAAQCLLTDRRNLVLMLNTADYPEAEVRMWYNPDQMENRQRAVFLAAADFIDYNLVVLGHA